VELLVIGVGEVRLRTVSPLSQIQLVFHILNWTECLDRLWDTMNYGTLSCCYEFVSWLVS